MTNLKQRFPAYSRALRLYPPAYYRQYYTQTLQTLADILDDSELSRSTKTKLYLAAWLDLGKSIPKQRVIAAIRRAATQPNSYFRGRGMTSLLLLVPAVLSVALARNATYSSLQLSSGSFPSIWFQTTSIFIWGIVLPLFATINALYALGIWLAARKKYPKVNQPSHKHQGAPLALAGLLLISLAGIVFLGFVATIQYMHTRDTHRNRVLSTAYQQKHLTLPCTLLPLASAQQIMGTKNAYMDNSGEPDIIPYSGIVADAHDQRIANCKYGYADESKMGVQAVTHEAFSSSARQAMRDDFLNQATVSNSGLNLQPITLVGYQGFYSQQQAIFDLSLWVKGYWLDASASSFESASTAMQTMVKNLNKELVAQATAKPAVSPRQILPLPITKPSISNNDQTQIEYAIMRKNMRVPAGTTLHAHIATITNSQAAGTFTYSTGLHGTFTAKRTQNGWSVVDYKEYKK